MAARVGFEPTGLAPGAFQERCLKPLGHLAAAEHTSDIGRVPRYRQVRDPRPLRRPRRADEHLIDLRSVVKTYVTAAGTFRALEASASRSTPASSWRVVGKSGSGKSTLINMITGIDRPTSGEVLVGGTAVTRLSEGRLAVWRGRTIGVVFQFFQLLPTLTLVENVMLPMDFCDL